MATASICCSSMTGYCLFGAKMLKGVASSTSWRRRPLLVCFLLVQKTAAELLVSSRVALGTKFFSEEESRRRQEQCDVSSVCFIFLMSFCVLFMRARWPRWKHDRVWLPANQV